MERQHPPLANIVFSVLRVLSSGEGHINEIKQYVTFGDWLSPPPLNLMYLKSIVRFACSDSLFLRIAE